MGAAYCDFRHGEALLAEVTGLSQKAISAARDTATKRGVHWEMAGRNVAYNAAGVVLVLQVLSGLTMDEEGNLGGQPVSVIMDNTLLPELRQKAPDTIEGRAHRFYLNRFLLGVALESGEVVNVRVKSTENFKQGMAVPLRKTNGTYTLARPLPRWPGKW
jgi:hypothetical protein